MIHPPKKIETNFPSIVFEEEAMIFTEGDFGDRMYFVLNGKVKLYNTTDQGEKQVGMIEKEGFFGEQQAYIPSKRTFSAKAMSEVKLIILKSKDELEVFMSENRWLFGKVMSVLGDRIVKANELLAMKKASEMPAASQTQDQLSSTPGDDRVVKVVRH